MNDEDLDRALAALKADDGAHLGSVSRRVMAQIERKRRAAALWIALAAAAATLAIVLSIPRDAASLALPAPLSPKPPIMALNVVKPIAPMARRAAARPRVRIAAQTGPIEVRMQTDDPNVLIIWLVDGEAPQETTKKGTL
ncbi:MAG TPA: hypothetical protein VGL53_15750 [Bryobacteraceae bacterium]|jgi:hypothetical protein